MTDDDFTTAREAIDEHGYYVFSQIAEHQGVPRAVELLAEVSQMPGCTIIDADIRAWRLRYLDERTDEQPANESLPADIVAYVDEHAATPERRRTMLGILAREVSEHGASLRTRARNGNPHGKPVVYMDLPGTTTGYAAVTPTLGGLRLTERYADKSPCAHFSEHDAYPVRVRLTGENVADAVAEFHRLAAVAFERRSRAALAS